MNELIVEGIEQEDFLLLHECLSNMTFTIYENQKLNDVAKLIRKLEEVISCFEY
jgi:hypothetical protein